MNLKKFQKADAEYGRLMAGRRYEDVSAAALAYERNWGAGEQILTACQPRRTGFPQRSNKHEIFPANRAAPHGSIIDAPVVRARTRGRPRLPCTDPETSRRRELWRKEQERCRARKDASFYQLQITVDAVELAENLLAVGLIAYDEVENRKAIQKAVEDVVNDLGAFVSN